MSLLLRRGHKGPGTDSDPCCGVLAFVGPFLRAVNQGKFHPSPGWTWCGSEPEPPEAECDMGWIHVALCCGWGSGGVLSVQGQQLQICALVGNVSRFPLIKQIPRLRSALMRRRLLLAACAHLGPCSIWGPGPTIWYQWEFSVLLCAWDGSLKWLYRFGPHFFYFSYCSW